MKGGGWRVEGGVREETISLHPPPSTLSTRHPPPSTLHSPPATFFQFPLKIGIGVWACIESIFGYKSSQGMMPVDPLHGGSMDLINLCDHLLNHGRKLMDRGQFREARVILNRLLGFPNADSCFREQAHLLLAEIHLDAQHYRKARRHLAVVLAINPEHAEAYYQMGLAIDLDPQEDPARALPAFRHAIRLNPEEALYWSGYAQSNLRVGKDDLAVRAFRRAAKLGAYDVFLLEEVIEGLCTLNRWNLAEQLLLQARFRMIHSPAIKRLWESFQFQRIHHQQRSSRRTESLAAGEAIVLKFVPRSDSSAQSGEPGILRHDRYSKAAPHVPNPSRIDPRRSS